MTPTTIGIVSSVVIATMATVTAITAVVTSIRQIRLTKRSTGADVMFRLEEKFYYTEMFRRIRTEAAQELLEVKDGQRDETYLPNFETLADFFEFVGVLVEEKAVSEAVAWNSFYRRAYAYWRFASRLPVLEIHQGMRKTRWQSYSTLLEILERQQQRLGRGQISDHEVDDLIKRESFLTVPGEDAPKKDPTRAKRKSN